MGQLFSRNWEQAPVESVSTPIQSTPRNKLLLNLKVDPRSPTSGGFSRTPIRVTGDDNDSVAQRK
jgi:hypothetical protein